MTDEVHGKGRERYKVCPCGGQAFFQAGCGAYVCDECGAHAGLVRCYCGWSASAADGRQELIDMGEQIEEDY